MILFKVGMNIFTKHLHDIDESYFKHLRHALYFSVNTFYASIALLLHSFLPFIFVVTGSSIITKLYGIMSLRVKIANKTSGTNKVAIVGFGASGIITLCNFVKNMKNISAVHIFDKNIFSCGVAYDTKHLSHLLNVKAKNMSIFHDMTNDFVEWLKGNGWKYEENDFVPRAIYALYLQDSLKNAISMAKENGVDVVFHHCEVQNIRKLDNFLIINDEIYGNCFLCTGAEFLNKEKNFWNLDKKNFLDLIQNQKEVHIVGTGLTAFDVIFMMLSNEYTGRIILHSRSGKLSQPHLEYDTQDIPKIDVNSFKIHHFIEMCRKYEWRAVIDSIRPITQDLWQNFSVRRKKSIMRHLFKHWNRFRHRSPSEQYAKINAMIDSGRIHITTKKPPIDAIYCTGFDLSFIGKLENALLQNFIVKQDEIKMGFVSLSENFTIIGAKNFGTLFEITAIPDIRKQIYDIVKNLK